MDSEIRGNRILQQDASFASFYSPKRRLADHANLLTSCLGFCGKLASGTITRQESRKCKPPTFSEESGQTGKRATRQTARQTPVKYRLPPSCQPCFSVWSQSESGQRGKRAARRTAPHTPRPQPYIDFPKVMRSDSHRHQD
ncbi:hypothetical protein AC1031_020994 [Aphanomyces cochlioides]|nr:hypothetical protein AC1031_020994 [Aphanomyces cochlioides]